MSGTGAAIPVLHYRGVFLNPTETFVSRQLEGLAAAGRYEPYGLCFLRTRTQPLAPEKVFAVLGEAPDEAPGKPPAASRLVRAKNSLNATRRRWGITRTDSPLSREAVEFARKLKPAVLHGHFGNEASGVAWLARDLGIPLVATFYGFDLSMLARSPIWRARYRRMFGQAAAVLSEGGCMLNSVRALGCPEEKMRLVRNPVLLDRMPFLERPFKDARTEPVDLLFTGRFVEKKGLIYALRALARLRGEFPGLRLNVVGDGELRPEIEREIARLGLGPELVMHGFLPYARLAELMERCDALVVPSVVARDGDSEGGAPNVILDAQASGMPVVGTTHCDIPEFTAPEGSRYLAPERDDAALADRIRDLLAPGGEGKWTALGRAGRAHVAREFDLPSVVARLHEVYDEAIRGGGG